MDKRISFYYEDLKVRVNSADDLHGLINLHTESFTRHGWEVIHVDETYARRHPAFETFDRPDSILAKSVNPWEYTRACYMRWLAYAVAGCSFADFDVINYGFTPEDAAEVRRLDTPNYPTFISGVGAMGLLGPDDYTRVIDTYLEFIRDPKIEGPLLDDINDMTIMRHFRPQWYGAIPYQDPRFVKDYTGPEWDKAVLVHYPHGLTEIPRVGTINSVRPPF